jgi:hypothetical protein
MLRPIGQFVLLETRTCKFLLCVIAMIARCRHELLPEAESRRFLRNRLFPSPADRDVVRL